MNVEKFICLKEVLIKDTRLSIIEEFKNLFRIGTIYEFEKKRNNYYITPYNEEYYLHKIEIEKFFIPLDKWRVQQINKIIND